MSIIPSDRLSRQQLFSGLLFASPFLVGFALYAVYPTAANLVLSFFDRDGVGIAPTSGLGNYLALGHDPVFLRALWNTFAFTLIAVPVTMFVGLALALLLNTHFRGNTLYRAVFVLPALVPAVAAGVMWRWVFPVNGWLDDPGWIRMVLTLMSGWGAGFNMILYLTAARHVPRDLYEAAELEGANAWARTIHVTLPGIVPVLWLSLLIGLIGGLHSFAEPYVLAEGTPSHAGSGFATNVLFDTTFIDFHQGYAAAMALIVFIVTAGSIALVFGAGRRVLQTR